MRKEQGKNIERTTSENSQTPSDFSGHRRRKSRLLQVIEHHDKRSAEEIKQEKEERDQTIKMAAYRAKQISDSAPILRKVIDDPPPRLGSVVSRISLDSVDSVVGAQRQVTKMWKFAEQVVAERGIVTPEPTSPMNFDGSPSLPRTPRPLKKVWSTNPDAFESEKTSNTAEKKKKAKSRNRKKCTIL